MGINLSPPRISIYTKIEVNTQVSGIYEFDRMFLILDDLDTTKEFMRKRVISSRELLLRIAKVDRCDKPQLQDAFKVWCWCTGACNEGKIEQIQFKADLKDYSNPDSILQQLELSVEYKRLLNYGTEVARMIEPTSYNYEDDKLAMGDVGNCGDLRLELWPIIFQDYLVGLKTALQIFPYLQERHELYIDKVRQLRNDKTFKQNHQDKAYDKLVDTNMSQFLLNSHVSREFRIRMQEYFKEAQEFISQYESIRDNAGEMALRIFQEEDIKLYEPESKKTILSSKISFIVNKYGGSLSVQSPFKLKQEIEFKQKRKLKKPIYDTEKIQYEISSSQSTFPTQFYWVYSPYYDTLFSAQSVALSELEIARKQGEEARKVMFKLCNAGQLTEKSVAQVFEIWVTFLSGQMGEQIDTLKLALCDYSPWVIGQFDQLKLDPDVNKFRMALQNYLDQYSPSRYKKLQIYYNEYLNRWDQVFSVKYKFPKIIQSELDSQDQYYALTNFYKNIRANDIYYARIQRLYDVIIKYNGEMGLELYNQSKLIIEKVNNISKQATKNHQQATGVKLNEIVAKLMPNKMGDTQLIQQRKSTRLSIKQTVNYYNEKQK